MRNKCRPCVTISTILKLIKIHFKEFMKDLKSFNDVQKYSCDIHYDETWIKNNSLTPKEIVKN